MLQVKSTDFMRYFGAHVEKVEAGETVVVTRHRRPAIKIAPYIEGENQDLEQAPHAELAMYEMAYGYGDVVARARKGEVFLLRRYMKKFAWVTKADEDILEEEEKEGQ